MELKKLVGVLFLWLVSLTVLGQQVNSSYLNPSISQSSYQFLRLGTVDFYFAGLLHNLNDPYFGKNGSFSLFTYSNRDLVLQAGQGNVILNHTSGAGNIGIGTVNPLRKLHVRGDFYLDGTSAYPNSGWQITNFFWKGHSLVMGSPAGVYGHNRVELKPGGSNSGQIYSSLQLYQGLAENQHDLRINLISNGVSYFNGGNVGIGTTNPGSYKLAVNGNIRAKEVRVEATGWPDFVFEGDYPLMDLGQLESYIKANKHLPEIPSAEDVESNGIELGEMNKLLLQKIEELTLYLLELSKSNMLYRNEIDTLNRRIEQLEIQLSTR